MRTQVIALEGADGVGKTTLINSLKSQLKEYLFLVEYSKEPHGEAREKLLNTPDMPVNAQNALMSMSRVETLLKSINRYIITDRWDGSNIIYQGIPTVTIGDIYKNIENERKDFDLDVSYIVFDLDPEITYERLLNNDREINRLDRVSKEEYLQLCKNVRYVFLDNLYAIPLINNAEKFIIKNNSENRKAGQFIIDKIMRENKGEFIKNFNITIQFNKESIMNYVATYKSWNKLIEVLGSFNLNLNVGKKKVVRNGILERIYIPDDMIGKKKKLKLDEVFNTKIFHEAYFKTSPDKPELFKYLNHFYCLIAELFVKTTHESVDVIIDYDIDNEHVRQITNVSLEGLNIFR